MMPDRKVTPYARKIAAQYHIDLDAVTATGRSGEILARDVDVHIVIPGDEAAMPDDSEGRAAGQVIVGPKIIAHADNIVNSFQLDPLNLQELIFGERNEVCIQRRERLEIIGCFQVQTHGWLLLLSRQGDSAPKGSLIQSIIIGARLQAAICQTASLSAVNYPESL